MTPLKEIREKLEGLSEYPWWSEHITNAPEEFHRVTNLKREMLPTNKSEADFIAQSPSLVAELVERLWKAEKALRRISDVNPDFYEPDNLGTYVKEIQAIADEAIKEIGE